MRVRVTAVNACLTPFAAAAAKAQVIYRTVGVPDHLGYVTHDGACEFDGVSAFEFLQRVL
jgi:hypothetical protein